MSVRNMSEKYINHFKYIIIRKDVIMIIEEADHGERRRQGKG